MFLLGLANAIYDRERGKWKLSWAQIRVTLSAKVQCNPCPEAGLFRTVRGVSSFRSKSGPRRSPCGLKRVFYGSVLRTLERVDGGSELTQREGTQSEEKNEFHYKTYVNMYVCRSACTRCNAQARRRLNRSVIGTRVWPSRTKSRKVIDFQTFDAT